MRAPTEFTVCGDRPARLPALMDWTNCLRSKVRAVCCERVEYSGGFDRIYATHQTHQTHQTDHTEFSIDTPHGHSNTVLVQ
jgi:hypothetical protein